MKSKTGNTCTEEFRRDALDLLQTSGKKSTQIARELGINPNTLRNWKKKALRDTPMLSMSKEKSSLSAEDLLS